MTDQCSSLVRSRPRFCSAANVTQSRTETTLPGFDASSMPVPCERVTTPQQVVSNCALLRYPAGIDATAPRCFDVRKAPSEALCMSSREISVGTDRLTDDTSSNLDRKTPKIRLVKKDTVRRKRQTAFKSASWYETASLSMTIKRQTST